MERLALLPANLLVSDTTFEWLKAGVPLVLQQDLRTAKAAIPGIAPDEATAQQSGATQVLRTSIESRGNALHAECTLTDPSTHKVIRVETADAASTAALLPALDQIAHKLDTGAAAFSTRNLAALQSYVTAQTTGNPQQRVQFLNQAIRQDANFGTAWVALMDMIVPRANNELKHMVDEAKMHRGGFAAYDGARFDMAIARLEGAAPAEQVKSAEAVAALAPLDLDALTVLGNNHILNGDTAAGEKTLRQAVAINPANIGLRMQLARGLLELSKFQEAEQLFRSLGKTPAVYPDLATCLLLKGDKKGADAAFGEFVSSLQNEELKPLLRASWEVISGDRKKGIDMVLSANFKTPNIEMIALSEATVWQAMGGDYDQAAKTAGRLSQSANQAVAVPKIAMLLADQTSASSEWEKKVRDTGLPDAVKAPLLAYGFFLRGNYEDAAKAWQQINDANHGADLRERVMLAAALKRAGKSPAHLIAVLPFVPEFADLYAAISFTELRAMRQQH